MVVKSWLEVWSSSSLRVGVIEPAVGSMDAMVVGGGGGGVERGWRRR